MRLLVQARRVRRGRIQGVNYRTGVVSIVEGVPLDCPECTELEAIEIETDDLRGEAWHFVPNTAVIATVEDREYRVYLKDQNREVKAKLPRWQRGKTSSAVPFVACTRKP